MAQKKKVSLAAEEPIPYNVWTTKKAILRDTPGIVSEQVSETIPNQTMSMQELVDRFVKGHNIPGLKNYPYDSDQPDEEPLPDISMMSKTEAEQFRIDTRELIKQNEQKLINTRKKIALQKQQAKEALIKAKAKEQKPEQAPSKTSTDGKQLK